MYIGWEYVWFSFGCFFGIVLLCGFALIVQASKRHRPK
jgi:hypothetical protein